MNDEYRQTRLAWVLIVVSIAIMSTCEVATMYVKASACMQDTVK